MSINGLPPSTKEIKEFNKRQEDSEGGPPFELKVDFDQLTLISTSGPIITLAFNPIYIYKQELSEKGSNFSGKLIFDSEKSQITSVTYSLTEQFKQGVIKFNDFYLHAVYSQINKDTVLTHLDMRAGMKALLVPIRFRLSSTFEYDY